MSIERRPRDYRGTHLPEPLPAHPLGIRETTMHACPECDLGQPKPFCPVCLGAGVVSTDRLDRYAVEHERRMATGAP